MDPSCTRCSGDRAGDLSGAPGFGCCANLSGFGCANARRPTAAEVDDDTTPTTSSYAHYAHYAGLQGLGRTGSANGAAAAVQGAKQQRRRRQAHPIPHVAFFLR